MMGQDRIVVEDYPCLARLAARRAARELDASEAHALYEHNWMQIKDKPFTAGELALIERLANRYGPL